MPLIGYYSIYPAEVCQEPKRVGNCSDRLPRFGHNPLTNRCVYFTYSGCGGNRNNFRSSADCELYCVLPKLICTQSLQVGNCKATIPRYYFNRVTQMCEQFAYTGCKGNDNNFQVLDDCQHLCVAHAKIAQKGTSASGSDEVENDLDDGSRYRTDKYSPWM